MKYNSINDTNDILVVLNRNSFNSYCKELKLKYSEKDKFEKRSNS